MSTPEILQTHPLVEEILDAHRDRAGGDDEGWRCYRAHVYRVLNFARALTADGDDRDDKLAIAAAFHDIDAFGGLDYLGASIRTQDAWLEKTGRAAWSDELAVMVVTRMIPRLVVRDLARHPLDPMPHARPPRARAGGSRRRRPLTACSATRRQRALEPSRRASRAAAYLRTSIRAIIPASSWSRMWQCMT